MTTLAGTNTAIPVQSEDERLRMSQINSLQSTVESLDASAGWWTVTGHWLTGAAAIIGAVYFITATVALRRSSALAVAQAKLISAKDAKLAGDLKEKDLKIASAEEAAGQANKRAAALEKEAAESKERTAALESETEQARANAAAANEAAAAALAEAAKTNERAALLEVEATSARLALAKLNERTGQRYLSVEKKNLIHNSLPMAPRGVVELVASQGNEIAIYAEDIATFLRLEGFDAKVVATVASAGSGPLGVLMVVENGEDPPAHALSLQQALIEAGVGGEGIPGPNNVPAGVVRLIVGDKPLPKADDPEKVSR